MNIFIQYIWLHWWLVLFSWVGYLCIRDWLLFYPVYSFTIYYSKDM